jgi:hypothetical protein
MGSLFDVVKAAEGMVNLAKIICALHDPIRRAGWLKVLP